jgi:hypothetical protein
MKSVSTKHPIQKLKMKSEKEEMIRAFEAKAGSGQGGEFE